MRMRMIQAQVEAAVVAATTTTGKHGADGERRTTAGDGRSRVANMVLSLEMDALVGRTVEIESALRVAHSALKDAETSHYW